MTTETQDAAAAQTATLAEQPPAEVTQKPAEATNPDLNSLLAALEHERISALAYFYWQQRGCPDGSPDEDWFRAEREVREGK